MFAAVNGRRYVIACACLLVVAGGLRFYDLGGHEMRYDEAVTALNSRGAFSDLIENVRYSVINDVRYGNTSPILYPLALWAVQRVESTEFSVRFMSAVAGTLTVGALLFLAPRAGVARRAAFLAGLLAAVCVPAILHSQGSREYSLGMLTAALLIVGALQYLRDGRRALLCVALFVGPLLQYGLVLFGAAALAAAAFAPGGGAAPAPDCGGRRSLAAAVWVWLRRRLDLLLPIGVFVAACGLSWALTARYQWVGGGWGSGGYLADYYYHGGYGDAAAVPGFLANRAWDMLSYHMTPIVAAVALLAFGWALARRRGRLDAVGLLALFGVGVAVCAVLASVYPFGGSHHNLYLGPAIFLAAGGALHSVAGDAVALLRGGGYWAANAGGIGLTAAGVVAIGLAGTAAIRQNDVHYSDASTKRAIAALEERFREGDAVYAPYWKVPVVSFYKGDQSANYFYSKASCIGLPGKNEVWEECAPIAFYEMLHALSDSQRVWLINDAGLSAPKGLAGHSQEVALGEVALDGRAATALYLIGRFYELTEDIRKERLDMYAAVVSEAPGAVSVYNLHLQDGALHYAKRPCAPSDTEAHFFLHIYPVDAAALPAHRRLRGFDNLDFAFLDYGFLTSDKCLIRRALPDYPINRIHAGQFIYPNGPVVWEAELPFSR